MKTRIYNMVNAWRKWLLTSLTFVLVVVICILFYNLYTTFTLNKLLTASIEDLLSKQYFSSVVIENREFELKTNGVFVPPTMRLIDANAKEKQLYEIIKKPVLILKISDMHCNSCIKDHKCPNNFFIKKIEKFKSIIFVVAKHKKTNTSELFYGYKVRKKIGYTNFQTNFGFNSKWAIKKVNSKAQIR